jgi:ribosomal protein L29
MKLKELKEKSSGELEKMLREERESVRALRFAVATNQETKVRKIRAARKTIARILTLIKRNAAHEAV